MVLSIKVGRHVVPVPASQVNPNKMWIWCLFPLSHLYFIYLYSHIYSFKPADGSSDMEPSGRDASPPFLFEEAGIPPTLLDLDSNASEASYSLADEVAPTPSTLGFPTETLSGTTSESGSRAPTPVQTSTSRSTTIARSVGRSKAGLALDVARIEQERLDIEKQRLQLEQKRLLVAEKSLAVQERILSIQERRLQIEERRHYEQERSRPSQASTRASPLPDTGNVFTNFHQWHNI